MGRSFPRSASMWETKQVSRGGVQQMIAYQHIQRRCQADCYSAWRSGGSRLKEQPRPGAWRLMCVCLSVCSQTKCLGSQKTNRDTCRLRLPAADKTGKEYIGPLAHMAALKRAAWFFFLFFFLEEPFFSSVLIHFLFLLNTCHFYRPVNEPNKIKHNKKAVVHSDHFYYKKNVGSRRKNRSWTKRLQYRQEIAAWATDPQLQHQD